MTYNARNVLIALSLITWAPLAAQPAEPATAFTHLGADAGLPAHTVWALAQDAQGYIWLGTSSGLARYDGFEMQVYRHDPNDPRSLPNDDINRLLADRHGTLWIATASGLARYDPFSGSFDRFVSRPGDTGTLAGDHVSAIAEADDGGIWLGAAGLNRLDPLSGQVTRFALQTGDGEALAPILALHGDAFGRVWIGTEGDGLFRFDPRSGQLEPFATGPTTGAIHLHRTVRAIHEDRYGELWVGTDGGLDRLHSASGQRQFYGYDFDDPDHPRTLSNHYVNAILEDSAGGLWIGTHEGGLNRYDRARDEFVRYRANAADPLSLRDDQIYAILEDHTGLLWFAGRGVDRLDRNSGRFLRHRPPADHSATSIAAAPTELLVDSTGVVWLGNASGMAELDPATQTWRTHLLVPDRPDWPDNRVFALHEGGHGFLYVGVPQHIALFLPRRGGVGRGEFGPDPGMIALRQTPNVIHEDSEGVLWAGMPGVGLARLPGRNGEDQEYFAADTHDPQALSGSFLWFVHEDARGRFWMGAMNGLNRMDRVSGRFERYTYQGEFDGPSHAEFRAVAESANGELWFGTGRGINRLSADGSRFAHYFASDGLAHDRVNALSFDRQGYLWAGTDGGLSRLNPATGEFRNFHVQHGLPDNQVLRLALAPDGELYVATYRGLVSVRPETLVVARNPPRVGITGLAHMTGRPSPGTGNTPPEPAQIMLTHRDDVLSFNLAVFDYRDPDRHRYAYRLEGIDRDWIHASGAQRRVSYSTLPPGSYRFLYRAADSTGQWTEPIREMRITVLPAPWRTPWAYALYAATVLIAFALAVYLRTRAVTARARTLETAVAERTHALVAQRDTIERQSDRLREVATTKDRLYANVSHEFRTPLTVILGPVERLLQREDSPDRRSHLETVRRNARRLLRLVEQLMDLARLDAAHIADPSPQPVGQRVRFLAESFRTLADDSGIQLEIRCDARAWARCDPDGLEKIVVNLLSNALKYTRPGGRVEVRVERLKPSWITIQVADTGIGIPADRQASVFERFYRAVDSAEGTPGSGLGLSLVREIVSANRGEIELESEEGVGTTVTVRLIAATPAAGAGVPAERSQVAELEIAALEPMPALGPAIERSEAPAVAEVTRAVIIEDNADLCRHVEQVLGREYLCEHAHDGETGLQRCVETVPDVVICDVMLPRLNGFEVVRQLKHDDRTCHIPVILLTARADEESRLTGLRTLADDYVTKPFSDSELRERVERLLAVREILRQRYSRELRHEGSGRAIEALSARDRRFIERTDEALEKHYMDCELSLPQFAGLLAMSERQLQRKLKAITNTTPREYIRNFRLAKARQLLETGERASDVAFSVGFTSQSYFTSCFKARYGMTPTDVRALVDAGRPSSGDTS